MRATAMWFAKDLLGKVRRQFRVPVFQRNYDWKIQHCQKLYEDIIEAGSRDRNHFTGIIVYSRIYASSSYDVDIIIDGQQRITTLHLLLRALQKFAKEADDQSSIDEINDYLFNRHCSEEMKLKLKPIDSDDESYRLIMQGIDRIHLQTNLMRNYHFFIKRIQSSLDNGLDVRDILFGIRKLHIVEIILENDRSDNPQAIFESINSTGLELSISDLVRNFLLMAQADQEMLYKTYWVPFEKTINPSNMKDFFSDYLAYKIGESVNSKHTYSRFKSYFLNHNLRSVDMLRELEEISHDYAAFLGMNDEYGSRINNLLFEIRILKNTTVYPFLIPLFSDYRNKKITEDDLIRVLGFLVNYFTRRTIAGLPTNVYKGTFSSLYSKVMTVSKEDAYERLIRYFGGLRTKTQIPRDDEIRRHLMTSDIYANRTFCKYLLMKITDDGQNRISLDGLTVEHIMPQESDSISWIKEVGTNYTDVHMRYLHTLGNLTIIRGKGELGSTPFREKKSIIRDCGIKKLNEDVITREKWNEEAILKRAERLTNLLIEKLHMPKLDSIVLPPRNISYLTLEDHAYAIHTKPRALYIGEDTFPVNSHKDILETSLKWLYARNRERIENLASYDYVGDNATTVFLTYDRAKLRKARHLQDAGIFFETNLSASQIIQRIRSLMVVLGEPYDDILIEIK